MGDSDLTLLQRQLEKRDAQLLECVRALEHARGSMQRQTQQIEFMLDRLEQIRVLIEPIYTSVAWSRDPEGRLVWIGDGCPRKVLSNVMAMTKAVMYEPPTD